MSFNTYRRSGYRVPRVVFPLIGPHVSPPDRVKWKMGPTLLGLLSEHSQQLNIDSEPEPI